MKKTVSILIIMTLLLSGFTGSDLTNVSAILSKVKSNYEGHTSISYNIFFQNKFFTSDDTIKIKASCKLIRDNADTLFNGIVWYRTSDSIEKYYDLTQIYKIDHPKKKITMYKGNKRESFIINGNVAGRVIRVNFNNTNYLLDDLKDSTNSVKLVPDPTPAENESHYLISFAYPNDGDYSEMVRKVWIRKKDFVIDKITYKAKWQGGYQYNEWNLSDIVFDNTKADDLKNLVKSQSASYTIEQFAFPTEKELAHIQTGTQAPAFSGTDFISNKTVSLSDYKGKIVLLDFSYMSCAPCVKSIPSIVKLRKTYPKEKVAILAINSFDGDKDGIKRLPEFIKNNGINYPVILTTRKTDSLYNIWAYPTLLALDRTGKVMYSPPDLSEKNIDSLKVVIDKNLK